MFTQNNDGHFADLSRFDALQNQANRKIAASENAHREPYGFLQYQRDKNKPTAYKKFKALLDKYIGPVTPPKLRQFLHDLEEMRELQCAIEKSKMSDRWIDD